MSLLQVSTRYESLDIACLDTVVGVIVLRQEEVNHYVDLLMLLDLSPLSLYLLSLSLSLYWLCRIYDTFALITIWRTLCSIASTVPTSTSTSTIFYSTLPSPLTPSTSSRWEHLHTKLSKCTNQGWLLNYRRKRTQSITMYNLAVWRSARRPSKLMSLTWNFYCIIIVCWLTQYMIHCTWSNNLRTDCNDPVVAPTAGGTTSVWEYLSLLPTVPCYCWWWWWW